VSYPVSNCLLVLIKTFLGHFAPGSENSRSREGQGTKVPGIELVRVLLADSPLGAKWPGSQKAVT